MIEFLKRFAKKIEKLNEFNPDVFGACEGDICNRRFCRGIIHKVDGCCTCFMGNPPCGYCVDYPHYCDSCGWESDPSFSFDI